MPIRLNCPCGKKLQVADQLAGKRTRCPGCDRVLSVFEKLDQEAYRFADDPEESLGAEVDRPKKKREAREREEDGRTPPVREARERDEEDGRPGGKWWAPPDSWVSADCYQCGVSEGCRCCVF